jgi:BlaI family penicillinase repressor
MAPPPKRPEPPSPGISEAEWQVMRVLWAAGAAGASAADVIASVRGDTGWAATTVKTLLGRLVKKGAVRTEAGAGRGFAYAAAVSQDACVREESRSFLARVFDGAAAPAAMHLIRGAKLSRDEIEQLRAILDQKEQGRVRNGGSR